MAENYRIFTPNIDGETKMINWENYLKEKNMRKRWGMLEADNRLSYDHAGNWLQGLKNYLEEVHKNKLRELFIKIHLELCAGETTAWQRHNKFNELKKEFGVDDNE